MKGILKPISIRLYGLFDEDGKRIFHFTIEDPEKRDKINHLWEQEVDYKDIVEEVGKKALTHVGPDVAASVESEEPEGDGGDEEAEEDNGEDA